MAIEAVVSYVIEKLNDHLIQEERLYYGVRHQLEWIESELKQIRYYLKDADSRQSEDERVNAWVAEIRGVCYNVEDFMDTFILNQTTPRRHGCLEHLKRCICITNELRTRRKAGKKIDRIKQKFMVISDRRETLRIMDINEGKREAGSWSQNLQGRREFLTFHEESAVVGLQEETKTLIEQLLNEERMRRVISIVGMGGSGKTTLAKKVCHDDLVRNNFECVAFIHLSQQYAMKDVLMRIINSTMNPYREDIENLSVTDLEIKLKNYLIQRRYLLVIDDIWSTEAWDTLNSILPDGRNGSRVMLTTRMKHIASSAGPLSYHHEMHLLNDDDSWKLFLKSVFPGSDAPLELKEIGKEIFAKCGGLPLAILALGGLLSRKDPTLREWSKVLASVSRNLPERFEQCRKILALSYWDLPYYLKPCFLYLGIFPGDYEISSEKLIRLWIAEGFIEQKDNQIMEDIAEDYLEELVSRSLVQATSRRSNGSIRTCIIHNLLRDFSISEARQNSFFAIDIDNYTSSSLTSVRRLVLHHSMDGYETINHLTATLRSILCFPGSEVPLSKLLNISGKLLRVLVADGAEFLEEVEVGGFVHLRYLEIAAIMGESLPSAIGNLSNLQTLKLSFDGTLPHAIWNLVQLRHLSAYDSTTDGHPKLQNLKNLQTLCLRAGSWIEDGLGKLTNLRTLVINGNLSSYHNALSHSICKLFNLQSLQLYDGHSIPPFELFSLHSVLYEMYLDGKLKKLPMFPPNMVELTLKSSLLGQDAISTLEKLPRLKILELLHESYDSKSMICYSGGFPCLELLKLCELPLECLIVEEGAMKILKSVELFDMSELKTDALPKRIHALIKQNLFREVKQSINQTGRKSGDISMPHVTTSGLA